MFDEDDLLPISALQHLAFCERQCALMYVEGLWAENQLTVQGRQLHDKTHADGTEVRGDVRICRTLRLHSLRLGLSGQADVVEFHRLSADGTNHASEGVCLEGLPDRWQPFPVEYKRGRPKPTRCDEVQMCAQALCLEEMLGARIPAGAIYYGQPHRRYQVELTPDLRRETEMLATRLHAMVNAGETPPARYFGGCRSCSMLSQCMPKSAGAGRSASTYIDQIIRDQTGSEDAA